MLGVTKSPASAGADIYVALLRGINVGGRHGLPMKALADLFIKSGCRDVSTFIQSGNVVYAASKAVAKGVPGRVARAIAEGFGFEAPVVVRSLAELEAAHRDNPFLKRGADEGSCHLLFLADRPSPAQVKRLDAKRSAPDAFEVRGSNVYLFLPNGVARTKLTNAYFDATLGTVGTLRNYRTVRSLIELGRGKSGAAAKKPKR